VISGYHVDVLKSENEIWKRSFHMQISKRFSKAGLCSLLFGLLACLGVVTMPVTLAQDEPVAPEISIENQVNINTADAETLALALDGVGETRAMDIISYREQNGDFETVEQLQEVSGIGPATLERNRSRILLSDSTD
jgi:competence protein ComEA